MDLRARTREWAGAAAALAGLYLLVLAGRWILISVYSSQVPFWDEWEDTLPLLRSFVQGEFEWGRLTAVHNAHIILTERLLALLGFWLNDLQWDAQMQSTLNALVGALIPPVLVLALCSRREGGVRRLEPLGIAVAALFWFTPILWFNAAWGFQSQFYFLTLFSLLGMILPLWARPLSLPWFAGFACLVLAIYSMGSGVLASIAMMGGAVLEVVRKRRFNLREDGLTLAGGLIIVIVGLVLHDTSADEKQLAAHSIGEFWIALVRNFAWPWTFESARIKARLAGLLLGLPAPLLVGAWLLRAGWLKEISDRRIRVLAALMLWGAGQLVVLSMLRGSQGRAGTWRHFDLHAVWIFVNAAALIILARLLFAGMTQLKPRWQMLGALSVAGLTGLLVSGAYKQTVLARDVMETRRQAIQSEIDLVRAYFVTGNAALLTTSPMDTPFAHFVDPVPILADPVLRGMLPAALRARLTLKPKHDLNAPRAYIWAPLPSHLVTPPGMRYWVSWRPVLKDLAVAPTLGDRGSGHWELPATRFRYLEFSFLGHYGVVGPPHLAFFPKDEPVESARVIQIEPFHPETWHSYLLEVDGQGGDLRMQEVTPTSWLALTEPAELGRMSVYCRWARENYAGVAGVGVALLALGYGLMARRTEENPA